MKYNSLKNKYGQWALVTGASSGIGEAFAHIFASIGINTLLVSNEEDTLQKVCDTIEHTFNTQAIAVHGDLTDRKFLEELTKKSADYSPGIIVNNAGFGIMGYLIQHDYDDYIKMLQVDEEAVLFLTHHFCRDFYTKGRKGAIINVSSANADFNRGIPFSSVYSSSKSMVKYLSEAVYYEMKPFGIDLLNVSPGPTKTSFQEKANTNTLIFCETPENVVHKSLRALGKKPSVTTNFYTKLMLTTYKALPLSKHKKMDIRAFIFGRLLGKRKHITLDGLPRG